MSRCLDIRESSRKNVNLDKIRSPLDAAYWPQRRRITWFPVANSHGIQTFARQSAVAAEAALLEPAVSRNHKYPRISLNNC
jgi:hypothetical protein